MVAAFALGFIDPVNRRWFVSRGASHGNPLRTLSPLDALPFASEGEAAGWFDRLPDRAKAQLADRAILVFPLALEVGEPVKSLTWRTLAPEFRGETVEHELQSSEV